MITNDIEVFPHQEKTKTVSEWLELRDLKSDFYKNRFIKVSKDKKYYLDDLQSNKSNREGNGRDSRS